MQTDLGAGILLIIGSSAFGLGAAVGVPQVFTERDPQVRHRMLKEHLGIWRIAQPFYGLGPVIASAGAGYLAADAPTGGWTRTVFAAACLALVIGGLTWAWSVYVRATRISEFAFGTLPGWPFATYVPACDRGTWAPEHRPAGRRLSGLARLAHPWRRHPLPGRLRAFQGHPAVHVLPPAHAGWRGRALIASGRPARAPNLELAPQVLERAFTIIDNSRGLPWRQRAGVGAALRVLWEPPAPAFDPFGASGAGQTAAKAAGGVKRADSRDAWRAAQTSRFRLATSGPRGPHPAQVA